MVKDGAGMGHKRGKQEKRYKERSGYRVIGDIRGKENLLKHFCSKMSIMKSNSLCANFKLRKKKTTQAHVGLRKWQTGNTT